MKKILSFILVLTLSLGMLLSCGSDRNQSESQTQSEDKGMIIFDGCKLKVDAGQTIKVDVNADIGQKNYIVMDVKTDAPFVGKMYFCDIADSSVTYEEIFFLPKDNRSQFKQILDYYLEYLFDKKLVKIDFKNVGDVSGRIDILSIKAEDKNTDALHEQPEVSMSSSDVRLTIGMKSGGAIHGLEYLSENVEQVKDSDGKTLVGVDYGKKDGVKVMYSKGVNLLNRFDHGRLVQQSYYGTSAPPYECEQYMGWLWGYNPVQGGNWTGVSSQIVDFEISDKKIYVKARPLDWAKGDKDGGHQITLAYMENIYTLEGKVIKVENKFTDFSGYTHIRRDQELPAFYGVISLGTLVTYRGDQPFQGKDMAIYPDVGSWMQEDTRAKWFDLNEHWMAWVNDDMFGVGIYTPDANKILAGKVGTQYIEGKLERAEATVYTAMIERIEIMTYQTFSYNYFLSVGQAGDMRKTFNELAKTESNPEIKKWNY